MYCLVSQLQTVLNYKRNYLRGLRSMNHRPLAQAIPKPHDPTDYTIDSVSELISSKE